MKKMKNLVQNDSQIGEIGHSRYLSKKSRLMVAMATEDYSEHQKVATWSLLGSHGDRNVAKTIRWVAI